MIIKKMKLSKINLNVIDSEKVVSINNFEDLYVKKLEDYRN